MTAVRTLSDLEGEPHANVFPGDEPKTVRLSLGADERVPPHSHPDRDVVFSLQRGEVDLHLDGETHRLEAGDVARFEGEREISPVAVTESTALVVLAPRAEGDR